MVRTNKAKMPTFDMRYRKAVAQKNAQRQKAARTRQDRIEEAKEDAEFDRVHAHLHSLNTSITGGRTKSNDPITQGLKRLDRMTSQLMKEEPYKTENSYVEGEKNRREAIADMQAMIEGAQARIANEVREARETAAAQRPLY